MLDILNMRNSRIARTMPAALAPPRVFFPSMNTAVAAGFPSPADDFVDRTIDLNETLIGNAPATFFVRVAGDSMTGAGIFSGDMLVVDRSLEARDGQVVVALIEGQFTVKRLRRRGHRVFLVAENPDYPNIEATRERGFEVWGVVTSVIRTLCRI